MTLALFAQIRTLLRPFSVFVAFLAFIMTGNAPVHADSQVPPDHMIQSLTQEVLDIVKADKDIKAGNTSKAVALIEDKVIKIFNFPHMTALAVGRHWRKADKPQKKAMVKQFKELLVRSYAGSLSRYSDQKILYHPLRKDPQKVDQLTMDIEVHESGKSPTKITYALEKIRGKWLVYDVIIEDISLIISYREGFSKTIQSGGIDGLISELKAKNEKIKTSQQQG